MEKYKKGDVNLLAFFLVAAIFVLGMTILWSKNWLIDESKSDDSSVFLSKKALDNKVDRQRQERIERLTDSPEANYGQKN